MQSLFKNQYKEPEEIKSLAGFGKLMGGFDKKPIGTPLGIEMEKPSFALDESLSHTQAQPITEVESRPISQPKEGETDKKGWLSNAWNKVKGSFGAEVTGGTDGPPKIEEGVGHKIMRYALPALMSLGGGAGLLPGLMAGMAGSAKGRQQEMEASTDWQKNKAANELAKTKAEQDKTYKDAALEISRQNAKANMMRANKPTAADAPTEAKMKDKYLTIMRNYKINPDSVSSSDLKWVDEYEKYSENVGK